MSNTIQFRRGTDAKRGTVVLASGEPGWTTDTKELYVGDGATYGGILVTGAGGGAGTLCTLSDVSCAGTADGRALTYQAGTWESRGTVVAEQIPALPTARITSGTFGIVRIPTMDDARIPDLETLSYGAAFATAQIPNLDSSKVTTGTFNANRIPALPTARITSGTFGLARIPSITNAYLAGEITSDKIPALSGTAIAYPLNADTVGTTAIKASGVGNAELAASGLDIAKFTVGTAGAARIPDVGVVAINYVIDGGGAAISAGSAGFLEVPFACHVDRWTLLADQHGSVVIDIWRDAYANYPPTDADSMSGTTNMPAISGTVMAQGADLSGWGTQGIASGDVLAYHVDSCSTITLCTIALKVTKT